MEIAFPIFSSIFVCSVLLCSCIRHHRRRLHQHQHQHHHQESLELVYAVIPYEHQEQPKPTVVPQPSAPPEEDPRV